MDVIAGLAVLAVLVYAVVKGLERQPPARRGTAADSAPGTGRRRASPTQTTEQDERRRRREDAADAAFVDGVFFSHYFLDRDDDARDEPYAEDEPDAYDDTYDDYGDASDEDWLGDDVFHDDFGDW